MVCDQEKNGVRDEGKSWCLFEKQISNVLTGIYIYILPKFEFYLKRILEYQGIYLLLKLVTLICALDCNVSWIYRHED